MWPEHELKLHEGQRKVWFVGNVDFSSTHVSNVLKRFFVPHVEWKASHTYPALKFGS